MFYSNLGKWNVRDWNSTVIHNDNNIKLKQGSKPNVKEDNANFVLVNAKHILWVCPLAMNKQRK